MLTRGLFLLIFVMAVATSFLAGASPARAADVSCSGTLGGGATVTNINGNVKVPDNASCTLNFVNVTGNVQAGHGSTLLITAYTEPSTIGGNVQAEQCKSALLQGNVTVGGNVQIQQCTGAGPNGFQGPDIVINGNFQCQGNASNAAPCLAWLGKVHGNVQIRQNTSVTASDVSLVDIGGNLHCESNAPAPTHMHGPDWVNGQDGHGPDAEHQCAGFSTTKTSIGTPVTPVASCADLATLSAAGFPVPNTVITSAVDTPATATLPERCIVNGYVNRHLSPVDNCMYQDGFQVQLPLPPNWNGRFMFQGGGGSEGSVPTATGTNSGSAGSNFGIKNGYAVASQDGGHENSDLNSPTCDSGYGNANEFYLDPLGTIGQAYQSLEVTALNAKYLINQYYGNGADHSYWVGCSTGGRQGMAMSETFPQYFDGIVAGDPVYDLQAIQLGSIWGIQNILNVYETATPPLPSLTFAPGPAPEAAEPIVGAAFPPSDQSLFETTLLQACDALDGVTDGVIDDMPACKAKFDPSSATYTDYAGALGPANTIYPLQCPGAKNATCLSSAQIQAIKNIHQGARTSGGQTIQAPAGAAAPDHVDNTVQGYAYDGGFMTTVGVPSRNIGTTSSPPGFFGAGLVQFPYAFISPANPTYNSLNFNLNTDSGLLSTSTPIITNSTSLDISKLVNYGHKIIWYHGASDPGPPFLGTLRYYQQMADQFGGLSNAQNFSRLYPVPNMDHCTGGATTDQFDMLTPLVNWVEKGTPPAGIPATGVNFNATTYQVVGNYITDTFVNAPTARSRLLCPFPQQARFTGSTTLMQGVSVAVNPADLANSANYTCIRPPQDHDHDNDHDHDHDHDR
jgi:hypothetical protein